MKKGSLTLLGSGIKFISHLTHEAKIYIRQAEKVLYLVNEPAMKTWIKSENANTESLDNLYTSHPTRAQCYQAIADYIVETVEKDLHTCVVLYGHPSVFAQPGLAAVKRVQADGYDAKILPGISAEACLFADLQIDPSTSGSQSFEATDFLIYQRNWDQHSHLILWQVDVIGALDHAIYHDNSVGINYLKTHLLKFYNADHEIYIYEAAHYAHFTPRIEQITLKDLPHMKLNPISTLYIPPAAEKKLHPEVLKSLGMPL